MQINGDMDGQRCYADGTHTTGITDMLVQIEGKDGSKMLPGDDRDDAGPEAPATSPAHARATWERFRRQGRAAGMSRKASVAYATREVEKIIPPPPGLPPLPPVQVDPEPPADPEPVAQPAVVASTGGVEGLGDIPPGWPSLPANATLPAEVAWVHANRLLVRRGEGVDLSRSLAPAPSYAALSWLETSILYPAKWADVTVKAAQGQEDDDTGAVRRERIALAEVATLLAEASTASA